MELKKQFGRLEVFSIAAGGMISSGIFILPAIAYTQAGGGIIISYFIVGLLVFPALFSKLELSTALPKSGGVYFYSERILGTAAGVVTGFASWFSLSMKSAFALVGIGAFASLVYPHTGEFEIRVVAVSTAVLFGISNLLSVKTSGKLQVVMVFLLLGLMTVFVLIGYPHIKYDRLSAAVSRFDWNSIIATTGMVFISYGGLTKVASVAGEVKDLRRNLVQGTFAGFMTVQVLYLLILLVMIGVMPPEQISVSLTPVTDTSRFFFTSPVLTKLMVYVTAFAAMLAFVTTANAGILAASRDPMAMGRDGLLPDRMSTISKKTGAPVPAVLLTTFFMVVAIVALPIVRLVKIASLFQLMLFIMLSVSVLIIRSSNLSFYKPTFRTPLYPLPQIIGIGLYIFLIIEMGFFTILVASGFVAVSLLWFFVYAKRRVSRKSALVHMIEQIVNPELTGIRDGIELDNELLDILVERNEIVEDRFDSLVRTAAVLDYDTTISREELFSDIAHLISTRMGIDAETVRTLLEKREKETSTLLYDGVALPHAIPHVVLEGEHLFDIVLVRNRYGIVWNSDNDIVYTAFCLVGSRDERNFHLKSLAAIAQLLMDPEFEKEWNMAKDQNDLRAAVLLVKRKRESAS
ncbi:MAG: amino acid permease [Spirochaetota bacterium]